MFKKFAPILFLAALYTALLTNTAHANLSTAQAQIPDASLVGEGRLKVLFWKVFDAQLYAPAGEWSMQKPFALSLAYLRRLKGDKIAERTIDEIRDQGFSDEAKLEAWFAQIVAIFPDVDSRTTITGVFNEQKQTLFFMNGSFIGRIEDPEFGENFFNIWLGEKSSQPKLRNQLIGGLRT